MENVWVATTTEIDTVDWKGNPIHLKNIPAIQNTETKKIRVYASEVSKAVARMLAEEHGLIDRDIPLLLLLYAKPGLFKGGEVHYKYHMNKMLFYLWKNLDKQYLGEAFPHDEFEPKQRGPVPKNLSDDLKRLEDKSIISLSSHQWGKRPEDASLKTELTPQGKALAEKLWFQVDDPFREEALHTKEQIFPLKPKTVMKKVHREYPEYQTTYVESDQD